ANCSRPASTTSAAPSSTRTSPAPPEPATARAWTRPDSPIWSPRSVERWSNAPPSTAAAPSRSELPSPHHAGEAIMATTTPVRKTRPGRKVHRLAAAVALMAGSADWASPAADAGGPPPTLQFTVSPDEFVVDATFDVTIEGTGCVDPAGPSAEPLVVAFWIKGGGVGSAPVDFHLGDFEVNPDGSFSETVEVDMALSRFRLEDPQGAAVVEGICADSW